MYRKWDKSIKLLIKIALITYELQHFFRFITFLVFQEKF